MAFPLVMFSTWIFYTAWSLQPAAEGHATHLQLGLNPCTILVYTGHPCPVCGATTTFAYLAQGQLWTGVLNQPFAALLFLLTLVVGLAAVADLIRPGARLQRLWGVLDAHEGALLGGFVGCLLGGWIYKAWLMGSFS